MAEDLDDETRVEPRGGTTLTVTNMIALVGAILLTAVLLGVVAEMDLAFTVGRIVSLPLLAIAIVVGARRRNWPALILPTLALAVIAASLGGGG